MAQKISKLQSAILGVIAAITGFYVLLAGWVFITYLLPLVRTDEGRLQDFLGLFSFSTEQATGFADLLLMVVLFIVLCLCELAPLLFAWYLVAVFSILSVFYVCRRFLPADEFIAVFGVPGRRGVFWPATSIMKLILSRYGWK